MDWYVYWYFTMYSIYKRFSWDEYFDVFATGMFSVFVSCLLIGLMGFGLYLFNMQGLLMDSFIQFAIPIMLIFIINYFIFLPKKRQLTLYNLYKEKQSNRRDLFTIFISVFAIVIMVMYGIKAHNYLNQ